jgi:hypothetical protein
MKLRRLHREVLRSRWWRQHVRSERSLGQAHAVSRRA